MKLHTMFIVALGVGAILSASVSAVMAGAGDTGALASCEIAQAQGIRIVGEAAVSIDFLSSLATATFKTVAFTQGFHFVVIRAMVGIDTGTSPMENVCQILNEPTAEGGASLAQQILTAVGKPNRTIKITKRGIFGCDVLPCAQPGLRPDFALVPGSDVAGSPIATALGEVTLFAVRP